MLGVLSWGLTVWCRAPARALATCWVRATAPLPCCLPCRPAQAQSAPGMAMLPLQQQYHTSL